MRLYQKQMSEATTGRSCAMKCRLWFVTRRPGRVHKMDREGFGLIEGGLQPVETLTEMKRITAYRGFNHTEVVTQ